MRVAGFLAAMLLLGSANAQEYSPNLRTGTIVPALPSAPIPATQPSTAPTITTEYRALLAAWFETHKRYPEAARQRGEEGRAVLRFRVDRSGRVLNYAVIQRDRPPRPRRGSRGYDARRDPAALPVQHDQAGDRGIGDGPFWAYVAGCTGTCAVEHPGKISGAGQEQKAPQPPVQTPPTTATAATAPARIGPSFDCSKADATARPNGGRGWGMIGQLPSTTLG
jgi:hypothetical protein